MGDSSLVREGAVHHGHSTLLYAVYLCSMERINYRPTSQTMQPPSPAASLVHLIRRHNTSDLAWALSRPLHTRLMLWYLGLVADNSFHSSPLLHTPVPTGRWVPSQSFFGSYGVRWLKTFCLVSMTTPAKPPSTHMSLKPSSLANA